MQLRGNTNIKGSLVRLFWFPVFGFAKGKIIVYRSVEVFYKFLGSCSLVR